MVIQTIFSNRIGSNFLTATESFVGFGNSGQKDKIGKF